MKLAAIGIALAVVSLGACGGSDDSEDVKSAQASAQEQADRFSSGDFEGAWDMWTSDAQKAVPQEDYVAFSEACSGTGAPLKAAARISSPGEAVARISLGGVSRSYEMTYEGEEWRWVPTDDTLASLEDGSASAIKAAKADGSCVGG